MNPLSWLCANLDATNQRTSKETFKLLGVYIDRVEVLHIDTGDIWKFRVECVPDPRRK